VLLKRILLGGIGLAIVWLSFLTVPLWLRNVDHPLMASQVVDVCTYLDDAVLKTLPDPPDKVSRGILGNPDKSQPACTLEWELPDWKPRSAKAPNLWVGVTTERMLNSFGGRPQRTDKYVDTWLKEAAASGSEVSPLKGAWRRGALMHDSMHKDRISVLADDAGVAVLVVSQGIDEESIVAFSEAITKALKAKRPPAAKK